MQPSVNIPGGSGNIANNIRQLITRLKTAKPNHSFGVMTCNYPNGTCVMPLPEATYIPEVSGSVAAATVVPRWL